MGGMKRYALPLSKLTCAAPVHPELCMDRHIWHVQVAMTGGKG